MYFHVSPCISMHFYVSFYISIYFHASLQRFPWIFEYFGAKSWISLAAGLRAPLSFPPPEFHAKLHPSNSPSEPRPGRDRDRAWALPMQAICSLQDPWRFLFGGGDFHSRVLLAGRLGGSWLTAKQLMRFLTTDLYVHTMYYVYIRYLCIYIYI